MVNQVFHPEDYTKKIHYPAHLIEGYALVKAIDSTFDLQPPTQIQEVEGQLEIEIQDDPY